MEHKPWYLNRVAINLIFVCLFIAVSGSLSFLCYGYYGGLAAMDIAMNGKNPLSYETKEVLMDAGFAAQDYFIDHRDSYVGMDAAGLKKYQPLLDFTDGKPKMGEIGVSDVSKLTFTLTYIDRDGKPQKVTKVVGSGIKFPWEF